MFNDASQSSAGEAIVNDGQQVPVQDDELSQQVIDRIKDLRERGYTCYRVAFVTKIPIEWVRAIAPPKTGRHAKVPYDAGKIRALRRKGFSYPEIEEKLGVSEYTVRSVCRGIVLTPAQKHRINSEASKAGNTRKARDRRAEARARNLRKREDRARLRAFRPIKLQQRQVEVPAWVPERLHDLYLSVSERDCEEQAALICRTLKHGGSVAYL